MVVAARIITDKLMIKVARVTDRVVVTAMVEAVKIMLRVDRAMAEARMVQAMVVVRDKVVAGGRDLVVVDRDRDSAMARTTDKVARVTGEVARTTVRAVRVTDAVARTMARAARAMAVDAARVRDKVRANTSSTATEMAAARA